MIRTSIVGAAMLLALGLSPPAGAIPITPGSVFNITGAASFNGTQVIFSNPESVTLGSGAFITFGTCVGCVTMTSPFTHAPFTPGQIYSATATNGSGLTTSFSLSSQVSRVFNVAGGVATLVIHDLGTAKLTGYDETPGEWVFTSNQFGVLVGSFSATSLASDGGGGGGGLPEPASVGLLGLAMMALGIAKRRKT